jgi:predicted PurR-regulated permease PerM
VEGDPTSARAEPPERVVALRPRNVLTIVAMLLALAAAGWIVYVAHQVVTWVLVSAFLATALDPAVVWLQRHGPFDGRAAATVTIYATVVAVLVGGGLLLIPTAIDQVTGLTHAAPGYVDELSSGRGPFGFLQERYHVVDRVRETFSGGGQAESYAAGTLLSVTRSVVNVIVGTVAVVFLTFFMVLEGPTWLERAYRLMPPASQPRWRTVASRIHQAINGYIRGNLLISVIAGTSTGLVLLAMGVPYPIALGLLVGVFDLIPLAGATIAGAIVIAVAFLDSATAGIVVAVFVVVYQQLENHLLQPLIYGRTVELSPLTTLVAVLVGAEVAGVLGALVAIPVANTLQILIADWLAHRPAAQAAAPSPPS